MLVDRKKKLQFIMKQREVTDKENIKWTPNGGAQTVRINLIKNW